MSTIVRMPKMSDTMQEGVIAAWLKKEGDTIQTGDILAEIETDKATMELESYEDGVLLYIGVKQHETVPVDSVLAIIGDKDTDIQAVLQAEEQKNSINIQQEQPIASQVVIPNTVESQQEKISTSTRIKVSPLAKKIAKEKGYPLKQIQGTGGEGRIIKRDIDAFNYTENNCLSDKKFSDLSQEFQDIPISSMRKTIAQRLTDSKQKIPHFCINSVVNMDQVLAMRKEMNAHIATKISINDIIVKATAKALQEHPAVNASWLGNTIRQYYTVNIGIAVAIDDGILVPVIRSVEKKTLENLSLETKNLVQKAKSKQLQPQEWEGATFTISNLGMFGVDSFTAIINPPASCILAIGSIKPTPIVDDNSQIAVANTMHITLSCDHRIVDGSIGALFLQSLKNFLEAPITILV